MKTSIALSQMQIIKPVLEHSRKGGHILLNIVATQRRGHEIGHASRGRGGGKGRGKGRREGVELKCERFCRGGWERCRLYDENCQKHNGNATEHWKLTRTERQKTQLSWLAWMWKWTLSYLLLVLNLILS